jgi:hypothetical protein
MFESGMKEAQDNQLNVSGFEYETFLKLIEWTYCDYVSPMEVDTALDLLQAVSVPFPLFSSISNRNIPFSLFSSSLPLSPGKRISF